MPKVVYIAGWGRSGSTLLDNVLGAHDGVFTAGEVTLLWQFGFLEGRLCGCGTPLTECALWRAVLARAFGPVPPDPRRMIALQRRAITVPRTPELLVGARRRRPGPAAAEYADVLSRLYRAVAAETGARVVVDATKRPPDAVATALAPGIEPYLIHLIRDPRACAFSWQRHKVEPDVTRGSSEMHRHGRLMNVGHWVSWNAASELVAGAYPGGRYLRLRYEDLMADPRAAIARVLAHVDEPAGPGPFRGFDRVELPVNHTIAGNPGRFRTGLITIRPDDEWRSAQRPVDRTVTTALALPLLHRYGYAVRVGS